MARRKAIPSTPTDMHLRGLSPADRAALDAIAAQRRSELSDQGATLSMNRLVIGLIRSALRTAGAYDLAGVAEQ